MYTHKNSTLNNLSVSDRRLAIAQRISETKGYSDPCHIAASVAHDLICAHDSKAWNSANGDKAYQEVLSVMVGQKFVTIA